jgi:hypothetical protein
MLGEDMLAHPARQVCVLNQLMFLHEGGVGIGGGGGGGGEAVQTAAAQTAAVNACATATFITTGLG